MRRIPVSILNWSKYSARQDRSNYSWFRLPNTFFDDVAWVCDEAPQVLLFLLCEASKVASPDLTVTVEKVATATGITFTGIEHTLQLLHNAGLIVLTDQIQSAVNG
jgi:hypothetical protein